MGVTPSKRRRWGRDSFYTAGDPKEEFMRRSRMTEKSWGFDIYFQDFMDGWNEAEDAYHEEERIRHATDEDVQAVRFFRDAAEADEIRFQLEQMGIEVTEQCACLHDYQQNECADFMDPCRAGVYLFVPLEDADTFHSIGGS